MVKETKTTQVLELFSRRHIGVNQDSVEEMLNELGFKDIDSFITSIIPKDIYLESNLSIGPEKTEQEALLELKSIAAKNQVYKSYIGQGYYNTHTPGVILRNVFENPGWYTSYTPYQPEISQGRLEALINYQTVVSDLTGMKIANASLLDEATAAAEAMTLAKRTSKSKSDVFFVDEQCFPQTINVIKTRAAPLGISIKIGPPEESVSEDYFGIILQYPGSDGEVKDFSEVVISAHEKKALVVCASDLLALCLLKPPGEFGADIVIGSSQRFGVPLGFGGPHAAFMATNEELKRSLPGRIVGASIDSNGDTAYRLALQTREQHIRREKATSNICTAQALLAIMAGFYAAYHGPEGIKSIAMKVHKHTIELGRIITNEGFELKTHDLFDTLAVITQDNTDLILAEASKRGINLRKIDKNSIGISLDETVSQTDLDDIAELFKLVTGSINQDEVLCVIPKDLIRKSTYLQHPVFNRYHTETEMLRYIRKLFDKDIALDRAMIPLGSCTMKLNATSEMLPVSWPEFSSIHPLVPDDQVTGYHQLISELEDMLIDITGYSAISLQPNAGSQGEYAGLLAIDAYHKSRNDNQRNICLIPKSAHGTNPASAQMVGMKVVPVDCDDEGNIDMDDLGNKVKTHAQELSALMITYPSTHGVFETTIKSACELIHNNGGLVYIDGANLNAMVGLCYPGKFGGDVSHLNLHKTFCIPHGGGGPGVGPVAAKSHLAPFLPNMASSAEVNLQAPQVSSAPFGSASILPISWMYLRMMGASGMRRATEAAILSANYIAYRLADAFPVLYTGGKGLVAHECIIDLRPIKDATGIAVEDVAKRLIDYGFHAPTMSFPVAGTLMIEPTESEALSEVNRFCEAMLAIRAEIDKVGSGEWALDDNPLINAPHTAEQLTADDWAHAYTRSEAAYPLASLRENKYFSPVSRIDNVYGDRNLVCSCPSISDYID